MVVRMLYHDKNKTEDNLIPMVPPRATMGKQTENEHYHALVDMGRYDIKWIGRCGH